MNTTRDFLAMCDRYRFDFGLCSAANGYAQIDTGQDAWYYGTWANPQTRTIVSYVEGDVTVEQAESDEEFVSAIRRIQEWNDANGWRFLGIDTCLDTNLADKFAALGLADLRH